MEFEYESSDEVSDNRDVDRLLILQLRIRGLIKNRVNLE